MNRQPLAVLTLRGLTASGLKDYLSSPAGYYLTIDLLYVGHLEQRLVEVPKDKPVAVICNVGHRAGLGASILLRAGYRKVYSVLGSAKAWVATGFAVTTD